MFRLWKEGKLGANTLELSYTQTDRASGHVSTESKPVASHWSN